MTAKAPVIPPDGTVVTAVPSVLTSKLDFQSRATAANVPKQVHGPLRSTKITTPFGSYTKCIVDDFDIDPATIRLDPSAQPVEREPHGKPPELHPNLKGHPKGPAGRDRPVEVKYSDDEARDDHGRWTDGGGGDVTPTGTGVLGESRYGEDDLRPHMGKQVTVTYNYDRSDKPYLKITGILTPRPKEEGNVRLTNVQTVKIDKDGTEKPSKLEMPEWEGPLRAVDHIEVNGPAVSAPDDRTYTGKYPEVDQAIKDARSILLREGPPTPDEVQARAKAYAGSGEFLQREMNGGLYSAWEMGQSGKTPQEWAADKFRAWYNQESRARPMMAAYGGARYADRLAAALLRAKTLDEDKLPQPPKNGGSYDEDIRRQAAGYLYSARYNASRIDLANKVAGYLTKAAGMIAAGQYAPAVPPELLHELRQEGYRATSIAAYTQDEKHGPIEQLGSDQMTALTKDGIKVPDAYPTGRAILAERAIRNVGAKIDAAIDAKTAGLAAQEDATRKADQATRLALFAHEQNTAKVKALATSMVEQMGNDPTVRIGIGASDMERLQQRLVAVSDAGSDAMRKLVEGTVPYRVRDAVLGHVDGIAKKVDTYVRQLKKSEQVLAQHSLDAHKAPSLVAERRNATIAVLEQVRPMGARVAAGPHGVRTAYPGEVKGDPAARKLMDQAAQYFPEDWLKKAAEAGPVNAVIDNRTASWNDATQTVTGTTYSQGRPPQGQDDGLDVMVHEMAHMMEARVPGIEAAEHAHWWQRCANDTEVRLGDLTGRGQGRERGGYDPGERTRPDKFFNPYVGKNYGSGKDSHYEILSMGMQSTLGGSWGGLRGIGINDAARADPVTGRPPFNAADPDLRNFVLGTVATV